MAIKFQYNKTSLQQIEKQLKMRQRTLPIIKSKETALRLEVKKCKEEAEALEQKLQNQIIKQLRARSHQDLLRAHLHPALTQHLPCDLLPQRKQPLIRHGLQQALPFVQNDAPLALHVLIVHPLGDAL